MSLVEIATQSWGFFEETVEVLGADGTTVLEVLKPASGVIPNLTNPADGTPADIRNQDDSPFSGTFMTGGDGLLPGYIEDGVYHLPEPDDPSTVREVQAVLGGLGPRMDAAEKGAAVAIATKTANYTASASDGEILVDATAGAVTITMPSAANVGQRIVVRKVDSSANAVTVQRAGTDTIDGRTSLTLPRRYAYFEARAMGGGLWYETTDFRVAKEAALNIDSPEFGGSLQAALDVLPSASDSNMGGTIIVPGGIRQHTTPLLLQKSGARIIAVGRGEAVIQNAVSDVVQVGTGTSRPRAIQVEGLYLRSQSGGGHVFASQGNGSANSGGLQETIFKGCRLRQDNAAKSIYSSVNKGAFLGVHFDPHCVMEHVDGATVPGFHLVSAHGELNNSTWDRCWAYYSGEYFIHIENTAAASYSSGNKIIGIVGEIMRGGLVKILSGFGNIVLDDFNWDMAAIGVSTRDWVVIGKSATGPASAENWVGKIMRSNGSLGGGLYDVKLLSGEAPRTKFEGGESATLGGYKVDYGPNTGVEEHAVNNIQIDNRDDTTVGMLRGRGTAHNQVPQIILGGRKIISKSTAPTVGTWAVGDLCINSAPAAGAPWAWRCTAAGTPGTWLPLSKLQGTQALATDANFTLTPSSSPEQTFHTGTLTANRAVTLSTTGAAAGDRFRVVRTGGGAFKLNVGTGPLAVLDTGQWCEVMYDGAAWALVGFGSVAAPQTYTQTYSTADRTHAARTAAALTNSTGQTPDTTIENVPDPADTPATADALRDDLVANTLPAIERSLADLADQVNKLKADSDDSAQVLNAAVNDLRSRGIVA